MSSREPALEKFQYFLCIDIGIELCLKNALLDIMHNVHGDKRYKGFPKEPIELFQIFSVIKSDGRLYLNEDQWKLLCPKSRKTDVKRFDISLIVRVLLYCLDLPADYKENCKSARIFLNAFKHISVHDIQTESKFMVHWNKLEKILQGVKYNDMDLFGSLYKSKAYQLYMQHVSPAVTQNIETIKEIVDHLGTQIEQLKGDQNDQAEVQKGKIFFFF